MSKKSQKKETFLPEQVSEIYRFFCDTEGEIGQVPGTKYSGYSTLRGLPSAEGDYHYVALRGNQVFDINTDKPVSASSQTVSLLGTSLMEGATKEPYLSHVATDYCYHKLSRFNSQRLVSEASGPDQEIDRIAGRQASKSSTLYIEKNTKNGKIAIRKEGKKRPSPKEVSAYVASLLAEVNLIEEGQRSLEEIFKMNPLKNQETRTIESLEGKFSITNNSGTYIVRNNDTEIDPLNPLMRSAISYFHDHNLRESEQVSENTTTALDFIAKCSEINRQIETGSYPEEKAKEDYKVLVTTLPTAFEVLLQGPSRRIDADEYNAALKPLHMAVNDVAKILVPLANFSGLDFSCGFSDEESLTDSTMKDIRSGIARATYLTDNKDLINSAGTILKSFHEIDNLRSYQSVDVYKLSRSNEDFPRTLDCVEFDSDIAKYKFEEGVDNAQIRLQALISALSSPDDALEAGSPSDFAKSHKIFSALEARLGETHPLIVAHRVSNQGYSEGLFSNLILDINHIIFNDLNKGLSATDPGYYPEGFLDTSSRDRFSHIKVVESDGELKLVTKVSLKINLNNGDLDKIAQLPIFTLISVPLDSQNHTPQYSFEIGEVEELTGLKDDYERGLVSKMSKYFATMRDLYQAQTSEILQDFNHGNFSSLSSFIVPSVSLESPLWATSKRREGGADSGFGGSPASATSPEFLRASTSTPTAAFSLEKEGAEKKPQSFADTPAEGKGIKKPTASPPSSPPRPSKTHFRRPSEELAAPRTAKPLDSHMRRESTVARNLIIALVLIGIL